MRYDRNEMLTTFLSCDVIDNETKLSKEEIAEVKIGTNSEDMFLECLKILLIAHSNGDGEQLCFKKVNVKIQEMTK